MKCKTGQMSVLLLLMTKGGYIVFLWAERMECPASSPDLTHWRFVRSAWVCWLCQSDQHNHVSCWFKNGMPSHTVLDRASGTVISALSLVQNIGELMEPESPPGQSGTGFGDFQQPQERWMVCYHLKKTSIQVNSAQTRVRHSSSVAE